MNYKETLQLPKTDFPMKADLVKRADPLYPAPAPGEWFPGMNTPPRVNVALPPAYVIASLSPRRDWDMNSGVLWGEPDTVEALASAVRYELSGETLTLFGEQGNILVTYIPG